MNSAPFAQEPDGEAVVFDAFRLFRTERLLLNGAKQVRLGGRAIELLIALIDNAGSVVGKDVLMARVWPKVVVEETSLRVHVGALRKALGDGQGSVRYITNIPGRGYSFVGKVSVMARNGPPQPLGSVPPVPSNYLPVRLTRMIGREQVAEAVARQLISRRFVTIIGPGGIGKTTLAIAVANKLFSEHEDGARFVDLAVVAAQGVPLAVAVALGISLDPAKPLDSLTEFLEKKSLLVVLDNCEHVVDAAARLALAILTRAPGVCVLATSREPLRVNGEFVHRLFPLAVPPPSITITALEALSFPAVQLLVERVVASQDDFELTDEAAGIACELCRRLDGIPLAIELAAARVAFFGLRELVDRLDDRLRLLSNDSRTVLPRHQTLRALIDWSHDLLSQAQQTVLRRLSVFSGHFTLADISAIVPGGEVDPDAVIGEVIELVAKSMVAAEPYGQQVRYRLLDTMRSYAVEKMAQNPVDLHEVRRRHAERLLPILEKCDRDWDDMAHGDWTAEYGGTMQEVRVALDWAFGPDGDVMLGAAVTEASTLLAHELSLLDDALPLVERALALLANTTPRQPAIEMRLNALLKVLVALLHGGSTLEADRVRMDAIEFVEPPVEQDDPVLIYNLWMGSYSGGDYPAATLFSERLQGVAIAIDDPTLALAADRMLAQSRHNMGRHDEAALLASRVIGATTRRTRIGISPMRALDHRVSMRIVLAKIHWIRGFPEQATRVADEGMEYALRDVAFSECQIIAWAACPIAMWSGDTARARELASRLRSHSTRHAFPYWNAWASTFDALLSNELQLETPATDTVQWDFIATLSTRFLSADTVQRVENGMVLWCAPEVLRVQGTAALRLGIEGEKRGEALFVRARELASRQGALSWELRAAISLAELWFGQGREPQAKASLRSVFQRFTEGFGNTDLMRARQLLDS